MSDSKIADLFMELMQKQRFVDWYNNIFVPECVEERPTPARLAEIKEQLVNQIKHTKQSVK